MSKKKVEIEEVEDNIMCNFLPHEFETVIERANDTVPTVYIHPTALQKMKHIVDIADKEIGWLGTCVRDGEILDLLDVYLVEQEVALTETTLTEEGLGKFAMELLELEGGDEIYNNIRFWGHSHVEMDTDPSVQDDNQMKLFNNKDIDWFLRGIANKEGEIKFTLFDYKTNIKYVDIPWVVDYPEDINLRNQIRAEIETKVGDAIESSIEVISFAEDIHCHSHVGNQTVSNDHEYRGIDFYEPTSKIVHATKRKASAKKADKRKKKGRKP